MQMGKICLTPMQKMPRNSEGDNDDDYWQDGEDQLEPLLVVQGSTVAGEAFREFCGHVQTNRVTFFAKGDQCH
jgi:hypothetical protein